MELLYWAAALILIAAGVIGYVSHRAPSIDAPDDGLPMPDGWRRVLVTYLLLFGVAILFGLVSVASVDFPDSAANLAVVAPHQAPAAAPAAGASDAAGTPGGTGAGSERARSVVADAAPVLLTIVPETTFGSAPTESLTLVGYNIADDARVRINALERAKTVVLKGSVVKVPLQASDLSDGLLMVDVESGGHSSNALTVRVARPRMPLIGSNWRITRETQLLLLALLAGALGSYLHALKSLADFIGNRTLTASWFWWYVTRPFLGMAMALIFYALLRGGLLAGTPGDARIVNPFGVIAIAAIVGMFADKASDKLAEIFDTLFKADDRRSNKLTAPVVDRLEPDTVSVNSPSVTLKIVGDRLGSVAKVRFNTAEQVPDSVCPEEVVVTLRPPLPGPAGSVSVTAVDADGTASTSSTLHVTDMRISDSSALTATAGSAFSQQLTATGGVAPRTWALKDQPSWLTVDDGGLLSGTPDAAGTVSFTAVVKDARGATMRGPVSISVQ